MHRLGQGLSSTCQGGRGLLLFPHINWPSLWYETRISECQIAYLLDFVTRHWDELSG